MPSAISAPRNIISSSLSRRTSSWMLGTIPTIIMPMMARKRIRANSAQPCSACRPATGCPGTPSHPDLMRFDVPLRMATGLLFISVPSFRDQRSPKRRVPGSALDLLEWNALLDIVPGVGHVHAAGIDRIYSPELHHQFALAELDIFLIGSAREFQNNRVADLPGHPEWNCRRCLYHECYLVGIQFGRFGLGLDLYRDVTRKGVIGGSDFGRQRALCFLRGLRDSAIYNLRIGRKVLADYQ